MFCRKCGNQIKEGTKFCPKCGAPISVPNTPNRDGGGLQKKDMSKKEGSQEEGFSLPEHHPLVPATQPIQQGKSEKTKKTKAKKKTAPAPWMGREWDVKGVVEAIPEIKNLVLKSMDNTAVNDGTGVIENLVDRINEVRDQHPELLFVNYNTALTAEKAKKIFEKIKANASERYSIKQIPSTHCQVGEICEKRLEIPGILKFEEGGYLCVRYDSDEQKKELLNQIVFHLMLQLPIGKVLFSFVDLENHYDEEFLLNNVGSFIYQERPITSESALENLLDSLDARQLEIIRKYGNYAAYCEKNKVIPIPYEFIVLMDDCYDVKYHNRLNGAIQNGYKSGVYVILFMRSKPFSVPDNFIMNRSGLEMYGNAVDNPFGASLHQSGIFYYRSSKNENCFSASDTDDFYASHDEYVARGAGDYEVVLAARPQLSGACADKVMSFFHDEMNISLGRLQSVIEENSEIVISSFPSEKEANDFITEIQHKHGFPDGFSFGTDRAFMHACYKGGGFITKLFRIALFFPLKTIERISMYESDLQFYMSQLGMYDYGFMYMMNFLQNTDGTNIPEARDCAETIVERNKENVDGPIGPIISLINAYDNYKIENWVHQPDLFDFTDSNVLVVNNQMVDIMPFTGICFSYWDNPRFKDDEQCLAYIRGVEKELHKKCVKKWGKDYLRTHLNFVWHVNPLYDSVDRNCIASVEGCGDYCLAVRFRQHETTTLWIYENPSPDALVYYTPITSNSTLLNACVSYINTELKGVKEAVEATDKGIEPHKDIETANHCQKVYYLNDTVRTTIQEIRSRQIVMFIGKTMDGREKDMFVKLADDYSENVLLAGKNDKGQATRIALNILISLLIYTKTKKIDLDIKIIDCLNDDEEAMHEMLLDMEFAGLCEIIQRKNRGKFLSNMAISILEGTAHNCVILILGQDRFRELKIGMELDENSCERGMKTYNDAINVILDKGPEFGVHTVVQLDKFSNLLYEDKFSPKSICRKFKHLILLHTDEDINALLSLNDDIPLNELNNSQDCLTAFYYDDEDNRYTLISPYMPLSSKETINLIKEN